MRIAVDAMGGDKAPEEIVKGVIAAAARFEDIEILLPGIPEKVKPLLEKAGSDRIKLIPCREVVQMGEPPVEAIRRKRDSSLRRTFDLTASGEADAAISAGNTGATVAAAMMLLKPLEGCKRPGIAAMFPGMRGSTVVIDVGANISPRPSHLLQYGIMAQVFAREVMGIAQPSVGILNVGEEDEKGTDLVKAAKGLLSSHVSGFVGNVEGRDIYNGSVDVVVCDGFVGNVVLKGTEGLATFILSQVAEYTKDAIAQGNAALKENIEALIARCDYAEYGGAPLLGVEKTTIICHGSSDARAIASAIRVARDAGARQVNRRIVEALAVVETPTEREAPG